MAKKPKAKKRRVCLALLDDRNILRGFETRDVAADYVGEPGAVLVPDECDLAPGKYRWNPGPGRFDPVAQEVAGGGIAAPDPQALRAIWKGFRSVRAAGIVLDPETVAWLEAYGKTLDAKG